MNDGDLNNQLQTISHDGHGQCSCHDHDGHDVTPAVIEEPLDPGNQSLADALRASFRVLQGVMVLLTVLYVLSGAFIVDQNEVAVVSNFGSQAGAPKEPGFHLAWPYPISSVTRVRTGPRTLSIDAFWLKLRDDQKTKDLSELAARGTGLDPALDGALITGDSAIMHLLAKVQYHVSGANDFVKNVSDEERLLRSILQNALIAESARTTADILWKDPKAISGHVRDRAQKRLDQLEAGITLDILMMDKSHYPLQVKDAFLEVSDAENSMRKAIQEANKYWEEKLKGTAGAAWEELSRDIERLDQVPDEAARDQIIDRIRQVLTEKATGEAGVRIKLAEGARDKLVDAAHTEADRFDALLEAYHKDPELVRQRLRQGAVAQIFSERVSRWFLPDGDKYIILNKDPAEIRQKEKEAIQRRAEGKKD